MLCEPDASDSIQLLFRFCRQHSREPQKERLIGHEIFFRQTSQEFLDQRPVFRIQDPNLVGAVKSEEIIGKIAGILFLLYLHLD
jgi:hypothetical protein